MDGGPWDFDGDGDVDFYDDEAWAALEYERRRSQGDGLFERVPLVDALLTI